MARWKGKLSPIISNMYVECFKKAAFERNDFKTGLGCVDIATW
jgi:hypothetical protein